MFRGGGWKSPARSPMPKALFLLVSMLAALSAMAQPGDGRFLTDRGGCAVWFEDIHADDSVSWSGGCRDGLATGQGTMVGYTRGVATSAYVGEMRQGRFHGQGVHTYHGDRRLAGHFSDGEPLFLGEALLRRLRKHVVSETDSTGAYVGDHDARQLYYHALVPDGRVHGTVVLLPGTWETTEHLLSSMGRFCELALDSGLAVIVPSINQRLTLTDYTVALMDTIFRHAIAAHRLPRDRFVIGGWSMGGIFSLRYAELARQAPGRTAVDPVAVFSCDGPCDLSHVYANFRRKLHKNPGQGEPAYGMREMERHCGGAPETAMERYRHYSVYSHGDPMGGNAQHLLHTPVRIYADVDPVWWMQNRHVDMYDLNALDQTAMIQLLNDLGNPDAEFINAYGQGVRLEGNRHPHSWSIVEPQDCIDWILRCLSR